MKSFVWIAKNNSTIIVTQILTTVDLLKGEYPSFFCLDNRKEDACDFIGEVFDTDIILIKYRNKKWQGLMVSFYGKDVYLCGEFNKYPIRSILNDPEIVSIEISQYQPI